MKNIKLDEVIIYWINNKENKQRYNHMNNLLNSYFPNNEKIHINAVMEKPKYNGVSMAHMIALLKGYQTKKPFLILEDDVNIVNSLKKVFPLEIENNISAVYLGISAWGNLKKWKINEEEEKIKYINEKAYLYKGAEVEKYNKDFIKINNMYCAHSILYLRKKYIIETAFICMMAVLNNKPHDIMLLDLQRKHNVLGLMYPLFYQDRKLGGQQNSTKIKIKNEFKGITNNLEL